MSDRMDNLKHRAAKVVVENEGKLVLGAIFGVPISILIIPPLLFNLAYMEDNIESPQAPQALERIADEMLDLSEQKDAIASIRLNQEALELSQGNKTSAELEKAEDILLMEFKANARETLTYILASSHLSEAQKSNAWDNFSQNIAEPNSVSRYQNDYNFGFVNDCRASVVSEFDNKSMNNIGADINSCLIDSNEETGFLPGHVWFILTMLSSTIGLPIVLGTAENKSVREWAKKTKGHSKW